MMPILMCHRGTSTQIEDRRLYDFRLLVWKMRYARASLCRGGITLGQPSQIRMETGI